MSFFRRSKQPPPRTSSGYTRDRFIENSWRTVREIRGQAIDDQMGQPLNDATGAIERAEIVKGRWDNDKASMIEFANGVVAVVVGLMGYNRFTLEEVGRAMGMPEDTSDIEPAHGLGAAAMLLLAGRPEFGVDEPAFEIESLPRQSVAEVGAWFATFLVRMEGAGRIDPLPSP